MTFLAPLWLLGLLPWLGVVAFLLVGRRRRVRIPFVELWKVPIDTPKPKKRIGPPPVGLIFAMIAMLVAIVAAGEPSLRPHGRGGEITVIVDRGISMSAGGRYVAVARELAEAFRADGAVEPSINLRFVPSIDGENETFSKLNVDAFLTRVGTAPPTAVDTSGMLGSVLASSPAGRPTVLISDRKADGIGKAIVQAAPADAIRNARIAKFVARVSPQPQVMVEVQTIGAISGRANLNVSSSGETVTRLIDLPNTGATAAFFIDLKELGPTVEAAIEVDDDFAADNQAWLVRRGSWPRLEPQAGVSSGVDRVIRLYAQSRPPAEGSARVPIVSSVDRLGATTPGIIVDESAASSPMVNVTAGVQVSDHPVAKDVRWEGPADAQFASALPKGEWTPVVRSGERVLVAVRESPARQVWIGFDSSAWQRSPDFVIFWANLFEWVGVGGPSYQARTVGESNHEETVRHAQRVEGPLRAISPDSAGPADWPGLYRRDDGTLQAVNAPIFSPANASTSGWQESVKSLPITHGGINLTWWFLLISIVLMMMSACAWKGSSLTGFSGTFTVASAEKTVDNAGPGSTGESGSAA